MDSAQLTQEIKRFAIEEAGFDAIGISSADLADKHVRSLKDWLEKGYAGIMDYMARDPERRADPSKSLPSVKTVIALALNYYHPEDPKPTNRLVGKVAKYAYGRDYHRVIETRLKKLCRHIESIGGEGVRAKSYVDTGPLLEKAFAQKAGLGFFGKNTNVITREFGSWIFLAGILTNLPLIPDTEHTGGCGSCRICIDACPTGALLGDYTMDARRCISYLTIESKEPVPQPLRQGMGEWAFGCDICQDVCPYNFRKKVTRHADIYPEKKGGTWLDLEAIEALPDAEAFTAYFEGSPIRRAKREGLHRTTKVIRENSPPLSQ